MLTVPPSSQMERSTSGGSVSEDGDTAPRPEFLEVTDLDVLAWRAIEGGEDGSSYDVRLFLSHYECIFTNMTDILGSPAAL